MFGVNMKVNKDGKETKLMSFDGVTIGVCNHGLKVVLWEVASLHIRIFKNLDNCPMKTIKSVSVHHQYYVRWENHLFPSLHADVYQYRNFLPNTPLI